MRKLLTVLLAGGLALTLAAPAFADARDKSNHATFTAQRDRDRGHDDHDGRRGYSRSRYHDDDHYYRRGYYDRGYYGRGYYRHRYGYYYGYPYYYDYYGYYGYPSYYRDSPSRQRECYDAYYYDRDFWYRYCQGSYRGGYYRGYQAAAQPQSPMPDQMNTAPGEPAPAADPAAPMTPAPDQNASPAPDPNAAPGPDPNMAPAPEPVAQAPGSDTGYPTDQPPADKAAPAPAPAPASPQPAPEKEERTPAWAGHASAPAGPAGPPQPVGTTH